MGRFWSLLFLLVPILGVGVFVVCIAESGVEDYWLPENINEHGRVIDSLFMFILYLTGVIFIGTGIALFWFLWKYDAEKTTEPVKYMHGSHTLEVVWSIVPAATLLFIAIYQMNAWADAKMRRPTTPGTDEPLPPLVEVTGRQFEWRLRYAGADGVLGTEDDVFGVNDLHIPVDEEIVMSITSKDVLHSFFLPNLRIKQDVVPGMRQHIWFKANKKGVYDIVCAELCGWGHYKMKGRLTITSRDDFDKWLAKQYEEQEVSEFDPEGSE